MQVKAVLYNLSKHFQLEICPKTTLPLKMGKMTLMPETGIHLGLRVHD